MGYEFGQFVEWDFKKPLDWHLLEYPLHHYTSQYVRALNQFYRSHKALYELDCQAEGFEWIHCDDVDHSVISFVRKGKKVGDFLVFVFNFTPMSHKEYRIGVPKKGQYEELFNSDDKDFGGAGIHNTAVTTQKLPFHGHAYSIALDIPPLSMMAFKKKPQTKKKTPKE